MQDGQFRFNRQIQSLNQTILQRLNVICYHGKDSFHALFLLIVANGYRAAKAGSPFH